MKIKRKTFADLNRQWFVKELLVKFLLRALTQQHRFACTKNTGYLGLIFYRSS